MEGWVRHSYLVGASVCIVQNSADDANSSPSRPTVAIAYYTTIFSSRLTVITNVTFSLHHFPSPLY